MSRFVGDECGDRDADEGVRCVPDEVEGGDFVGEELYSEEDGGDRDHPWVLERVEALRQQDPMEVAEDA